MIIHFKNTTITTLSLLCLGACTMPYEAGEPPHYFGNAVEQNIAAQIVNPDAPESNEAPEHVGIRTTIAQGRYMADKVEKPRDVKTSSIGGDGGN